MQLPHFNNHLVGEVAEVSQNIQAEVPITVPWYAPGRVIRKSNKWGPRYPYEPQGVVHLPPPRASHIHLSLVSWEGDQNDCEPLPQRREPKANKNGKQGLKPMFPPPCAIQPHS